MSWLTEERRADFHKHFDSDRAAAKLSVFMMVAEQISLLGTCPRKAVGAVLVRNGRCISWGYNGAPPGLPHCVHLDDQPCSNATHAEANALAFAACEGISTDGCTLFVTVSPCEVCARLLIAAGVSAVYYLEAYRDPSGLEILYKAEIPCQNMSAS